MSHFLRAIPPLIWLIAALLMFPYFLPTAYSLPLFAVRAAATLALLLVAVASFRIRAQTHMSRSRAAAQSVAAIAVLGICLGVAMKGTDLIKPSEGRILTIIQAGLKKQGAEVASGYKDLNVSSARCKQYDGQGEDWHCIFDLSYTVTATGERFSDEPQHGLYLSHITGDAYPTACEYDFQWSQKLRALPSYDKALEPLIWSGCDTRNSATHSFNSIGSGWTQVSFMMSREPGKPGTLELVKPSDQAIAKIYSDTYPSKVNAVKCGPLEGETVMCAVTAGLDGIAAMNGDPQVWAANTRYVTIYRQGKEWALK
jgi:hypothetical protein